MTLPFVFTEETDIKRSENLRLDIQNLIELKPMNFAQDVISKLSSSGHAQQTIRSGFGGPFLDSETKQSERTSFFKYCLKNRVENVLKDVMTATELGITYADICHFQRFADFKPSRQRIDNAQYAFSRHAPYALSLALEADPSSLEGDVHCQAIKQVLISPLGQHRDYIQCLRVVRDYKYPVTFGARTVGVAAAAFLSSSWSEYIAEDMASLFGEYINSGLINLSDPTDERHVDLSEETVPYSPLALALLKGNGRASAICIEFGASIEDALGQLQHKTPASKRMGILELCESISMPASERAFVVEAMMRQRIRKELPALKPGCSPVSSEPLNPPTSRRPTVRI